MLIKRIQNLRNGTAIPKPEATATFEIKGWATRRGEPALIYRIPNHRTPNKPLEKGITVSEFELAYAELVKSGEFTRAWFNSKLAAAAREGGCNYTSIGGIFQLLGAAKYADRGRYVHNGTAE